MRILRRLVFVLCVVVFPLTCLAQDQRVGAASTPAPTLGDSVRASTDPIPGGASDSGSARLRDRLNLENEQLDAWTRYTAAIDAYSKLYYSEKPLAAFASESGARQIGRMVDSLQNRLAALEGVEAAARELYALLNPTQKKIADQAMASSIPVFASAGSSFCPEPSERKGKPERNEGTQRSRRGTGGIPGMGGM